MYSQAYLWATASSADPLRGRRRFALLPGSNAELSTWSLLALPTKISVIEPAQQLTTPLVLGDDGSGGIAAITGSIDYLASSAARPKPNLLKPNFLVSNLIFHTQT